MKSTDLPKYAIGSLATMVFVGLVVWLVRSEGQRARQMLRDDREQSEAALQEVPAGAKEVVPRPGSFSAAAPNARDSAAVERRLDEKKRPTARTPDAKPAVAAPPTTSKEDFDLKDHDVFPAPSHSAPKPQNKRSAPSTGGKR